MLAASPHQAAGQETTQTIQITVGSDIESVAPHHATTFAEHTLARTLHRGLVQYNANGEIEPGLADSWTISSDGRVYTFTLKPNLTWSDGQPLTAADVVAGITHALDPLYPSPFAAKLFAISDAEAYKFSSLKQRDELGVRTPDPATVIFELDQRTTDFLDTLTHPVAMPVPALTPNALGDGILTSGSYRLEQRTSTGGLIVEPVQTGPSLEVNTVRSATEAWDLSKGQTTFITAALPMVTVPAIGTRGDDVKVDRAWTLYAYGINTTRPPFNTIEARHALAMAINRIALLEVLPPNTGTRANQYVPPAVMGQIGSYKAPFAPLTFEEREAVAAALLSEQGFGRESPLRVTVRIPLGDVHRALAEKIADMWAASGIETEIIDAPLPDHWRALENGDFDVAFMAWPGRRDTPHSFLEPLSQSGGAWNFPRYAFNEFTDRLTRATTAEESDKRHRYYREAEKAIIEDQALIALFFYRPVYLVSPNVVGWRTNSTGQHSLASLSVRASENRLELIRPSLPQAVPSFGESP